MTKRITDKEFVYVPAVATDISKTFQRVRERMAAEQRRLAKRSVVRPRRQKFFPTEPSFTVK